MPQLTDTPPPNDRWWELQGSAWYALLALTQQDDDEDAADAHLLRALRAGVLALAPPPAVVFRAPEAAAERAELLKDIEQLATRSPEAARLLKAHQRRCCARPGCGATAAPEQPAFQVCAACGRAP
jgi:hypothetical protein